MPRCPDMPCSACGKMLWRSTTSAETPICRECRRAARCGTANGYRKGCRCDACREAVRIDHAEYVAKVLSRDGVSPTQKARPAKPKPCIGCGDPTNGRPQSFYCGPCGAKLRRTQRTNWITKDRRVALYERDNWTCQICGEPVDRDAPSGDRLYPTLDHIEPQSVALIPDHSDRNLRCAHLACNSKRGNRATAA